MAECIDRQQIIGELNHIIETYMNDHTFQGYFAAAVVTDILNNVVMCQPSADVATVRNGRWEWKHRHRGGFRLRTGVDPMGETHTIEVDERYEVDDPYCSECGKLNESVFLSFCPNCGAKMDKEVEENGKEADRSEGEEPGETDVPGDDRA